MYFGVLGEYAKILFASSQCTHRFFPRILRIHLNTFRVFGDDFVPQITPICNVLHRCLNTILVFSVYAERMKNTQREFFTINNAWGLQRESVSKKSNGGYMLA